VANFIVSGYKDIKINTLSDKEHYIIKADPYLLAQVFENIIINAIQAMDKKEISLFHIPFIPMTTKICSDIHYR